MNKISIVSFYLLILLFAIGCSKKHYPSTSPVVVPIAGISNPVILKADSVSVVIEKPKVIAIPAPEFPKVIVVNDSAATKSIDGRLYYDIKGHRYWRNFKDGKYYLFNKSMYNNDDFKAPVN